MTEISKKDVGVTCRCGHSLMIHSSEGCHHATDNHLKRDGATCPCQLAGSYV